MKSINRSPITILAIDAAAEGRSRLQTVFSEAGYQCVTAADTATAGEVACQATPDLIVCEVNLAGHSGLVACEELRRQHGWDEVPVMFLSATQTPDIIRRNHAGGGTYYLRKPFEPAVLLQLVEKALLVPHLTA